MKALRIVQIVLLLLLLTYFIFLHAANPTLVNMPFLLPVSPALGLGLALVLGWLIGWAPGRIAIWRHKREIGRLRRRIAELEQHVPSYDQDRFESRPVIPDRIPADEEQLAGREGG